MLLPASAYAAPEPVVAHAAPPAMQAAVLLKLLVFNKQIAAADSIVVHVVGSAEFAEALREAVGTAIGSGHLARVTEGRGLPSRKPHALYVGDAGKVRDVVAYTRENDVLSMTGLPELMQEGVTLGVGVESEKLRVYFDAESSREEGATWEAGLLKVVGGQQ